MEAIDLKALLLIDMQKDFLATNGALYSKGIERVIPNSLKLIDEFRKLGLPIITTMDSHVPEDTEFKIFPVHCLEGSPGIELIDEVLQNLAEYGEHHILRKSHYSAFYGTDFDELINTLGIDEFHVAGVVTNICVLFTVEELRNRGLKVFVYKDAVYTYSEELHDFALSQMRDVLGAEVI